MRKRLRSKSTIADLCLLSTLQCTTTEILRRCCSQLFPSMTARLDQWKRPNVVSECLDVVARYYLSVTLELRTRTLRIGIHVGRILEQRIHGLLLWDFKVPSRCLRQQAVASPIATFGFPASTATLRASVAWWCLRRATFDAIYNSHTTAETLRSPLSAQV